MRTVSVVLLAVIVVACGGKSSSPTAPTTATPTTPTTATPTTVAGNWGQSGTTAFTTLGFMTLTQNGAAVTGSFLPTTAIGATEIGTVTGTVSGSNVLLTMQMTVAVPGNVSVRCRWSDSWNGQLSGDRLTGTFSAQTTPPDCNGGTPPPAQTFPHGAVNFFRF